MNKSFLIRSCCSGFLTAMLLVFAGVSEAKAAEYYFSSSAGNNSLSGSVDASAKRNFTDVEFSDGDTIYLKSGDVWNERLSLSGLNGITILTYGGDECAVIDRKGDVNEAGIVLTNCSDVWISSVCVKNAGAGIVFEYNSSEAFSDINVSGCEFYSIQGRCKFDPASQIDAIGNYRRSASIEIVGEGGATVSDVTISECRAYMGDALLFVNVNDAENSLVQSVENLHVRNSYVSGSLTHGIHISGVKRGSLSDCVITEGRPMDYPHGITGIFLAASRDFTIERCEISYIRNYHDNPDGSGIDIEGNNVNTTITECNIHHCDGMAISMYYANVGCKIISNTFYMNDMDEREQSCILVGDAKKPSSDILIKDNMWYQMRKEGFGFIKNLNPEGEYNITQDNNTKIEATDGVIYAQNFDYFPVGGRINGLLTVNPERGKTEIAGNHIERNLYVQAYEAGYKIGRALPEMTAITAKFKIKPLSGQTMLNIGKAEILFDTDAVTFDNIEYPLDSDLNEFGIFLDAETGKYELFVNSKTYQGLIADFTTSDGMYFIAKEPQTSFLIDDLTVLKGYGKAEFLKSPVVNKDTFTDFAYNGRIAGELGGDKRENALVINKIIKSGTTTTQRAMNFTNTSFCVNLDLRSFDNAEKEILIKKGDKTYLTLCVRDGVLNAVSNSEEKKLVDVSEGKTYKLKLCYDNVNLKWSIRINDIIFSLASGEKVSSDKIYFRILPGGTGVMQVLNLSAYSLGDFEFVNIDDADGDITKVEVQLTKGENFNGGAYVEANSIRMYRNKTDSNSGISGEMKLPLSETVSGKVRLSFDVLLENYRMINHITLYGHNADGNEVWATALRFAFDSYGRIQYVRNNKQTGDQEYVNASASGSTSATRYDYNRFINVVFEINTDNQTADVYIDGVSVVRNVALINSVYDISAVGFRYYSNQTQGMRVKNICFEEYGEGFSESFENADNFLSLNDGGTVKCEKISYGVQDSVMFEKYSACQKVFRTYAISKDDYKAFTVSGGFVFGKSKGKMAAIELLDGAGESVLEISVKNGGLYVNGEEKKSILCGEEVKLLLAVYDDNKYYLIVDGLEVTDGELKRTPTYYRSGIDFNNSGSFEIRNFENVYYFENCVRVTSNYSNNMNSDNLYSYKNIHFLGNDAGNNVNVEFIR